MTGLVGATDAGLRGLEPQGFRLQWLRGSSVGMNQGVTSVYGFVNACLGISHKAFCSYTPLKRSHYAHAAAIYSSRMRDVQNAESASSTGIS